MSMMIALPPGSTLFPYTTLFRSRRARRAVGAARAQLQSRQRVRGDVRVVHLHLAPGDVAVAARVQADREIERSEEHTSELQSHSDFVCRLLLEKKKVSDVA